MNTQTMPQYVDLTKLRIPHVIKLFFLMDILLCTAYLINHLLGLPYGAIATLLDLNGEHGLVMWYSSMQLFCVFLLTCLFCCTKCKRDKQLWSLMILPSLFLFMSIDEAIQIHEWLGQQTDHIFMGHNREETSFKRTGIWVFVIGVPFIILFKAYVSSIKQHFQAHQQAFKKLLLGMAIMLGGAVGVETLVNFISYEYIFLEVVLEEGMEMIGATIMLWAAYEMALDTIAANPSILTKQD